MRLSGSYWLAALALVCAPLGACASPAPPTASAGPTTSPPVETAGADGPHAPADRVLAPPSAQASADGQSTIIDLDLGNVTAGQYAAPVRGVIVTPRQASGPTPVIVVSHLRAPNCSDQTFAYPCADGATELRFDRGMTYLGQALASAGYTVLIPDLGGIFVGSDLTVPYDQHRLWRASVQQLLEAITRPTAAAELGVERVAPLDLRRVGLVTHSRSGTVVESAQQLFGPDNLRAVLAYAPAYDTFDLESISPAPAAVPYLAVVGLADADVGPSANLWLGHYLGQERQHSAAVVALPGLGHLLVNPAASAALGDDRRGCDLMECPDAATHERVLTEVSLDWLGAHLLGADTQLPVRAGQELPATVAGLPAHWLAATPQAAARLAPADLAAAAAGTAQVCRHVDPMNPEPVADACPEPEQGVVQIVTPVAHLTDAIAAVEVAGARGLAVHVAPAGTDPQGGAALRVTLTLRDGQEHVVRVPPTDPALRSRASEHDNGSYQLGTIRVALPPEVSAGTITQVRLRSDGLPVEVRGVDFWQ
ncbi:alpha/beta hydrolase family protein [Buchananella hordeovulneris]|uniref:alpha/beta hydrolase family protein n=1 Tax=Buchananella hordeovulneris TaxID=52770 RepID=UPI000F5F20DF|nr:hypothetical protein [Buchananella hordeovulneris]RRD44040.1 hypothetical protein EII13_04845 [Buchananella hordeovulneris]